MRGHDAHANVRAFPANDRHRPGEPAWRNVATEMHLDFLERARRQLALRGMEILARQPQASAALDSIGGAAGQHDQARADVMRPPLVR